MKMKDTFLTVQHFIQILCMNYAFFLSEKGDFLVSLDKFARGYAL